MSQLVRHRFRHWERRSYCVPTSFAEWLGNLWRWQLVCTTTILSERWHLLLAGADFRRDLDDFFDAALRLSPQQGGDLRLEST